MSVSTLLSPSGLGLTYCQYVGYKNLLSCLFLLGLMYTSSFTVSFYRLYWRRQAANNEQQLVAADSTLDTSENNADTKEIGIQSTRADENNAEDTTGVQTNVNAGP